MPDPKRGRTNGRRRSVVSVSLDGLALHDLDALVKTFTDWRGRPLSRSAVVRKLIKIGAAAVAGRDVRDLRQF